MATEMILPPLVVLMARDDITCSAHPLYLHACQNSKPVKTTTDNVTLIVTINFHNYAATSARHGISAINNSKSK